MRIKYLFVYIGIGVAFAAVSLWVLLSGGKNAKALRAKYKLGGALLTTWALLSAATCGPRIGPPEVLCYDMPAPVNQLYINPNEAGTRVFSNGDVLEVIIRTATAKQYTWQIATPDRTTILQEGKYVVPEEQETMDMNIEVKLNTGSYKGDALFILTAHYLYDDGELHPEEAAVEGITIN